MEFLEAVIVGRTKGGAFIYAERRLEQLNLLLADLQPLLSVGAIAGLQHTLQDVVSGFANLRDELEQLEEAQELVYHAPAEKKKGDKPDEDDKPDDEAGGEAGGEAEKKSSLVEDQAAAAAGATDGKADEKKPGLWGRLWNRGKKDEGGGA
jgi:hypothetical protein